MPAVLPDAQNELHALGIAQGVSKIGLHHGVVAELCRWQWTPGYSSAHVLVDKHFKHINPSYRRSSIKDPPPRYKSLSERETQRDKLE